MPEPTLYDAYPYRSRSYIESHVDRLNVIARLFGMNPAPVENCRALEIGCADGGNLVPMAEALPNSEFVGLDLAETQIRDGLEWIEPLGMKNITLLPRHFNRLPQKYGNFDYIICHGVYSWIPENEQAKLLETIRARLTPQGVAYVSYNTRPGWHTRTTLRDFLMSHSEGIEDLDERVSQARMLLQFFHDAMPEDSTYGQLIRTQCQQLIGAPPQYLLHGLLAEHNHPIYFKDFVRLCKNSGLQYLGDAEFGAMMPDQLPKQTQTAMEQVPGGLLEQEQVQDYLVNRAFRRSLLVPEGVEIERSIPWEVCEGLWMSARARLLKGEIDGPEDARFDAPDHVFVTDNPVVKAGLSELSRVWPDNLAFPDWVRRTSERCGRDGLEVRATLGRNVLPLFTRGVLRLHPRHLGAANTVSDRPAATPWTLRRAHLFRWVTDMRHGMRTVPPIPRFLLQHCDGKTSRFQLGKLLKNAHRLGDLNVQNGDIEAGLERALQGLLERALLVDTAGSE